MFTVDRVLGYAAVAFVIIIIPGPTVLFTISRALTYGRRTAVLSVLGNTCGMCLQGMLVAFGLGTLVQRSVVLFTVLKFVGAAYLVYLGVMAFRHRHTLRAAMDVALTAPAGPSLRRTLRDGFVVGFANPKIAILYSAILPQFVNRAAGHADFQMAGFVLINVGIALVCDSAWGFTAGTARDWFARSPRRLALVGGAGGLAMIGLGTSMAFTGRKN
jgi:threonine/homoserine/homoserine lactone efflux protein